MEQFKSHTSALHVEATDPNIGEEDIDDTGDAESSGRALRIANSDPLEDLKETGSADASEKAEGLVIFSRAEGTRFFESLEDNETFFHVINVGQFENAKSTVDTDSEHLVEHIEVIGHVENSEVISMFEDDSL